MRECSYAKVRAIQIETQNRTLPLKPSLKQGHARTTLTYDPVLWRGWHKRAPFLRDYSEYGCCLFAACF